MPDVRELARAHASKALRSAAVCVLLLPRFLLAALVLWLLDFLCIRRKVLARMREREGADGSDGDSADDPAVRVSDSNRMFTLASLRAVWHGHKLDFFKTARVGAAAPNSEVVPLAEHKRARILDYARGRRPLILNFGSCS
ncbi:hypothetical protein NFI96_010276 [Prochilodus magdalenae]|nr:hypothetical protein NFI96_010276 [Prochilodus magdalenae]